MEKKDQAYVKSIVKDEDDFLARVARGEEWRRKWLEKRIKHKGVKK